VVRVGVVGGRGRGRGFAAVMPLVVAWLEITLIGCPPPDEVVCDSLKCLARAFLVLVTASSILLAQRTHVRLEYSVDL
jgi:hypothetical protein